MDALRTIERRGITRIELAPEALADDIAECDRRSTGSVWTDGGWRFDVAPCTVATAERDAEAVTA